MTKPWLLSALVCLSAAARSQVTLPIGTQLPVALPDHVPMKVGQPLRTTLLYAVYVDDKLTLPAKTIVLGSVIALTPDHRHRVKSRLRADFTPFRTPVVRFNSLILPGGTTVPITTTDATDGAPVYRLVTPPPRTGGLIRHTYDTLKQAASDRIHVITGPDKRDRLVQFVYSQLPYHPQRIEAQTSWTIETAAPVDLALTTTPTAPNQKEDTSTWLLEAYLNTPMSSITAKAGQAIQATVAEPVIAADGSTAVPQGSILSGTITDAQPARRLNRPGQLHFAFNKITLPGQDAVSVQASLKGADLEGGQQLNMDAEGNVKPKPQDKLIVPAILILAALRPLDQEEGGGEHHLFLKNGVASNSLGFIGFIVGTAARQPNIAAGLGFYGAALSIYERLIARGKEVVFPQDTRVTVETTARRTEPMRPTQH